MRTRIHGSEFRVHRHICSHSAVSSVLHAQHGLFPDEFFSEPQVQCCWMQIIGAKLFSSAGASIFSPGLANSESDNYGYASLSCCSQCSKGIECLSSDADPTELHGCTPLDADLATFSVHRRARASRRRLQAFWGLWKMPF